MKEKLSKLKEEILNELSRIKSLEVFRELEIKYLGRKGELAKVMKAVAELSGEEIKEAGRLANELKNEIRDKFEAARAKLDEAGEKDGYIDISLPGEKINGGHLSPITLVRNDLEEVFRTLGFRVLEGPELESDFYCFESLNIPKWHPARDMQDTFYIDPEGLKVKGEDEGQPSLVMRTHTSPMQVRAMQKYGAPLRCVVPGRVFRAEATDAVHEHTFDQLEGLMIDEDISMANLIAIMKQLLRGVFGEDKEVRVRPGYFPFVEPGIELDIRCTICGGVGCPSCKNSGWLEILPAGLVHPRVLEYGGIDTKKYQGFAFGLGLTRLAMMKYGIGDIRLFNSGDLRFSEQF